MDVIDKFRDLKRDVLVVLNQFLIQSVLNDAHSMLLRFVSSVCLQGVVAMKYVVGLNVVRGYRSIVQIVSGAAHF